MTDLLRIRTAITSRNCNPITAMFLRDICQVYRVPFPSETTTDYIKSQMNIKHKTRDIQTWKKEKHLFLDMPFTNTDTPVTSPYQCVKHSALKSVCFFLS
jgi:hypothetical protein